MLCTSEQLEQQLAESERLWLFLDYDGTLADFAPTPEHVDPDPELVGLLTRLEQNPRLRISVISGRRLGHVRALLPVPGVLLAGTYGIELQTPEGEQIERVEYETIRPVLEVLKPRWELLITGRDGFFLEDKGWSLALHARFADGDEANEVLVTAHRLATEVAYRGPFRLLGGHKYLEIGPELSHKGRNVEYLLEHCPWPGALPLYLGDDDKDEEAFGVIQAHGGTAILVAREARDTQADCRLESPRAVRRWLETLLH
jgi:trehalose 6-phosphate phosphatase